MSERSRVITSPGSRSPSPSPSPSSPPLLNFFITAFQVCPLGHLKEPIIVIVTLPLLSGMGETTVQVLSGSVTLAPQTGHVKGSACLLPPLGKGSP